MRTRLLTLVPTVLLVVSACSGTESAPTTTVAPTTTTTTLLPTTTAATTSTTTTSTSTTTTVPESTTTTEPAEETTTTTTRIDIVTTTTVPPEDAISELIPYSGLYRQPTVWNGYLDFRSNGVIAAGTNPYNLTILGTWSYDEDTDSFTFTDFDFGDGCKGESGVYERDRAFGGGRRITLVEDPCQARVDFIVQPGSSCMCFLYNVAELPDQE